VTYQQVSHILSQRSRRQAMTGALFIPFLVLGACAGMRAPSAGLPTSLVNITAGEQHTCSLTSAGAVKCWGLNHEGQLGDGTRIDKKTPVDVTELTTGAKTVAAGERHTCAVTHDRAGKCWGDNEYSQLGDGTGSDSSISVAVKELTSGLKAVAAGGRHTCALTDVGGVKCWGLNHDGQLGDGTVQNRSIPVDVLGLSNGVMAITAGRRYTCALTNAGSIKCWGKNHDGQLGDGTRDDRSTPGDVVGLTGGVKAISAGWRHACALTEVGGVKCWGKNHEGQLGDGTGADRITPVDVVGVASGAKVITAGGQHACALTFKHAVCWGDNEDGQLGDGTTTDTVAAKPEVGD
jgi:alpha-tubulin suppressor-like RCC1 family protein